MAYWLVKNEVEDYSIDDFKKEKRTLWVGVRNYQARNFLQAMKLGDEVLYYHSNGDPSGIAGLGKVSKTAIPDPTQFDKKSDYFEKRATQEKPVWFCPELQFVEKFNTFLGIPEIRKIKGLETMKILERGSRLSVTPVTEKEFDHAVRVGRSSAKP